MKIAKLIMLLIVFFSCIFGVNAHGADITEDVMVISDDSTSSLVKSLVDDVGYNIAVYKFTNDNDVIHQLDHALTNPNKKILVVSYQNVANNFLKEHEELNGRVIVVENNENDIKNGLTKLNSINTGSNSVYVDTHVDYTTIILIIIIVGLLAGLGIFLVKRR